MALEEVKASDRSQHWLTRSSATRTLASTAQRRSQDHRPLPPEKSDMQGQNQRGSGSKNSFNILWSNISDDATGFVRPRSRRL